MATFQLINFNAWTANPADYVGRAGLATESGEPVAISRQGILDEYVIVIGTQRHVTGSNANAAAILNKAGVGLVR